MSGFVMKNILLGFACFLGFYCLSAQNYQVSGVVVDGNKQPVMGANVVVKGTNTGVSADFNGKFTIKVPSGNQILVFSGVGLTRKEVSVNEANTSKPIKIELTFSTTQLEDVQVVAESKASKIEMKGFTVAAIETAQIKAQSLELNTVLARAPGVRVRKTGGIGSDFEYSLNGLSGNAIRFFIDGIPMDYYGSSYSINNIPIALIDRVDIYKGVVPVDLGSDALGGAINLVTNQNIDNYLSASYSYGSFNTHQTALHGQWRSKSGFTTKLSAFYTYSDNNYKVWGRNVFYAESNGRITNFTKDNPAERFNDDFQTISGKLDIGFTNKKWADQFFIGMLVTDQKKGVQTGQTMSHVYGELRNKEKVVMPNLTYKKKDLFTDGLDVNVFAGYSEVEGVTIDTTTVRYDWNGDQIGINPSGGEIGRGGSKSLYTLKDKSLVSRLNTTYQLPKDFKLGFNLLYTSTERTGDDPFAPDYEIPFLMPQDIASYVAGLSLETIKFEDRLRANIFIKKYGFTSSINELVFVTQEYENRVQENNISNWGGGLAASFELWPNILLKSSVEQATRMPSATEALGNGVTITSNPFIKPEQSLNANLGAVLGRFDIGARHGVKIALSGFYRKVTDQLQLNISGGQEIGEFINIRSIGGTGAEFEMVYDYDNRLKLNLNGTYVNLRNRQKFDENGNRNNLFGDRLRNQPYIMANGGLEYNVMDLIQKESRLFAYLQSSYVHEFFLRWPSAGNQATKETIPTQLVFDTGIGYTFPSQNLTLAVDVSNLLNEQVYDNFLLQKPGRAVFVKINYQIL